MKKHGDERDVDRRRNHVSNLQDGPQWRKRRTLPPANKTWPTCLIIAPTSVVPNWEREFETVSSDYQRNKVTISHTVAKWGYFEVGSYTGSKKEREDVLTDFKMGRLDVGTPTNANFLLFWLISSVNSAHYIRSCPPGHRPIR
jgi:SNF2 family DNA or RNA helicase